MTDEDQDLEDLNNLEEYNNVIICNQLKTDVKHKINVLSFKYDYLYLKYYRMHISILVISSLITAINAFVIMYSDIFQSNKMFDLISKSIVLILSTTMTLLTSIIRFRNYREKLEKLKEAIDILHNVDVKLQIDQYTNVFEIKFCIEQLGKINILNYVSVQQYDLIKTKLRL